MPYLEVTFLNVESLVKFPTALDAFLSDEKNYVANFSFEPFATDSYTENDFLIKAEYPIIENDLNNAVEKHPNFRLNIIHMPSIRYAKWTVISEETPEISE